jgi:hypothetical protein
LAIFSSGFAMLVGGMLVGGGFATMGTWHTNRPINVWNSRLTSAATSRLAG